MRTLWRILACMVIGLLAAIIALLLHSTRLIDRLEFMSWDARQRMLASPAPDDLPIKLILIDQQSLDWANEQAGLPWPWPREFYAPLISFCHAGGAKAIAFDMFFSEPSMYGQDDDDRFAAALKEIPAIVLAVPSGPAGGAPGAWPEDVPRPQAEVAGFEAWRSDHSNADITIESVVMSIAEIAGSVSALGHVRGDQDADSIIRRVTPIVTFDGAMLLVLGLAMFELAEHSSTLRYEDDALLVGSHYIPLDGEGTAILRFRSPTLRGESSRMYEAYSASGVINAQLAMESDEAPALLPDVFKDCYVIIGLSAPGTYDLKPTPINKAGPGVEVHATFLDNLLHDDFMRRPREWSVWLFTIGLSVVGVCAARASRNSVHVVLAFVLMLPVPWVAGVAAFERGMWWPIVTPELGLVLALIAGLIANYATEGRQRRFIKRSFQRYLSPDVIEQIVRDPSRLRLGGERREVTIMFSDIAGFSGIAERLDARELADLLNAYLTAMTDIILEEGGTLDKYIGDAIVAFWNAPLDQPDHAQRAVRAALKCQHALNALRSQFGSDLSMRIGINTGMASVGNFGSEGRFDYTAIGHTVNLASRLEGANKFFMTNTLVAHETWQHVHDTQHGREVGLVRVVGVQKPVRVHEVQPNQTADDGWHEALSVCQRGTCAEALAMFERMPDDPIARRYAAFLRVRIADGEQAWDGVWELTEK